MRREWDLDDLIASWTLVGADQEQLVKLHPPSRLGNTRLVDRVLNDPQWTGRLTVNDLRGLTPLFWSNVALHGTFDLDLDTRIDYDRGAVSDADAFS